MSEVIEKAANINFIADNMINKISELRKQYDAAQATNDSSLIYDMERTSKPELGDMYQNLNEKVTEYFADFDYIFGDFSYDKVRLKGYNDSTNKKANKINNIKGLEDYKKNYCSYGAKTFLLKKVS